MRNALSYFVPVFSILCVLAATVCAAADECECCQEGPRSERISIRHIEAKGIGYHHGYSSLELFLTPLTTYCKFMPFIDARGHIFNNGKFAANAGAGLRFLPECVNQVFGFNAFYDYRNTRRQHYNQVSAGLEVLGERWDYRINGYLPVGKTKTHFFNYFFEFFPQINGFTLTAERQLAMKGGDAEVGYHFPEINCIELYSALGPYYYASRGNNEVHTVGGRLRILGTFYTYFTVEAIVTYDHLFKWIGQGAIALNIPFGPHKIIRECECSICDRMLQRVQHNEIIVLDKHRKSLK